MKRPPLDITPDTNTDRPDDWKVSRQRNFKGGETQAQLAEMVGRDQLLRMENTVINENDTISELMRMDEHWLVNAANGVALVRKAGGTYDVYWASGNNIYVSNASTLYSTPLDVTTGTISGCTGCYLKGINHAVQFLGKYYAANPNPDNTKNGVLNLTDKTLTLITGKTSNKLRRYTNRLWVVNSDGTFQCSDNGDASTWNALNIYWLPNQEPAIDFIPVQGGAIVYSQNSIYAMYGASYTDISFTLILTHPDLKLTSGAVCIDNTVYMVSTKGVIKATLNEAVTIPHEQETFFKSNFFPFSSEAFAADVVTGIYLQKIKAIYFSWAVTTGGTQSFIFYLGNGAYSKVNQLLPAAYPYMLAVNDTYIEALIGTAAGTISICRNTTGITGRTSYIQTRHEDCDSVRDKVFRCFTVVADAAVTGFTLTAYQDESATGTVIASNVSLVKGDNHFWLHLSRSRTISFLMAITGPSFNITEMRLKYRDTGETV